MILKNNKRIDGCSDTVPVGTLNPFLGTTAPYGYLICQGQKVSKTTYKELYEICGDTFGKSTDTEFYLPDLRGQTIAGYKEGDSTFGTLGGLIGSLTHLHSTGNHTLTIDEMPTHYHRTEYSWDASAASGGAWGYVVKTNRDGLTNGDSEERVGGSQPHNHGDTSSASSVQPTIVLNWIVKAFQLMPNQSYVSTVSQESDINTYSCNYINDTIPDTQNLGKIIVDDIKCRQLFDKNDIVENYYLSYENGEPTWDSNMAYMKSYIEVEQNTKYTMSNSIATIFIIHMYDSNKNYLGYVVQNDTNNFYTTSFGNDTKYVRLSCGKTQKDSIMFEKGDKGTSYIPYKKYGYNSQESMGEIVVDDISCKNMLDLSSPTTSNGITSVYNDDGSVSFSGTITTNWADLTKLTPVNIPAGTKVTFSIGGTREYSVHLYFENGERVSIPSGETSATIITTANHTSVKLNIGSTSGTTYNDTIYAQLELGDKATPYTPHKEFSNKQIYSTEEQIIGTWMGKPLYRKVINIKMPDGTIQRHNLYNTGLSSIITRKIYGTMYVSGHMFPLPMYNLIVNESCLIYTTNNGESIDVELNCDFSNYTADIILEYTKIND